MVKLIISPQSNKQVKLILQDNTRIIDAVDFSFDKNLDTLLISSIDKFLKRNRIDTSHLKLQVKAGPGVDKNSSLLKIIESFKRAMEAL